MIKTVLMSCVVMVASAVFLATGASANGDDGPENQFKVELFPAPDAYRMGGFPPGMTRQSFTAAHGSVVITLLDKKRTKLEFDFAGLIPNGVYTMWNVLTPKPEFSDEPLGPTGYGKHGVIADDTGGTQRLKLKLDDLHDGIVKKSDYYVSCADFTSSNGTYYDLDFMVVEKDGEYKALQGFVHKVGKNKRKYHLENTPDTEPEAKTEAKAEAEEKSKGFFDRLFGN